MKKDTHSVEEQIKIIRDSLIVIHNSQRATMAWLINVGTKQSAQLALELKAEMASVDASLEKLSQI